MRKALSVILLISIFCLGLLTACQDKSLNIIAETDEMEATTSLATEESDSLSSESQVAETDKSLISELFPNEPDSFIIGMVGDVLIHDSLINGTRQEDGSYDFRPIFEHLKPYLEELDYSIFDMEGTFRGEPYAGYPSFSTPEDLAPNLKEVGFDLAITANNHAIDFGIPVMHRTLNILRAAGLETVGTRLSPEEPKFLIKELGGIKVGISSWTYESARMGNNFEYRALNNQPFNEEDAKMIDSFYAMDNPALMEVDAERIRERIKEMRAAGAESLIFLMHWGTEYMLQHDFSQAFYAQTLADEGVDLVLACGPHVAQPIREVVSEDGKHHMLCYYSVGNCVSNQQFETGNSEGHAQDGMMAVVKFARKDDGSVAIRRAGYVTHTAYKQYPHGREAEFTKALYLPLEAALANPAAFNLSEDGIHEAELAKARMDSIMENNKEIDFTIENLLKPSFD